MILNFKEKIFGVMIKKLKKNNANKSQYAMLEDKLNVNKDKKQDLVLK